MPDRFCVVGLAAGSNIDLLAKQVEEFHPEFIYYSQDYNQDEKAQACRGDFGSRFLPVDEIAVHSRVDTVIMAISGGAGFSPTSAAVRAGKTIALANKESLVMAGEIITGEVRQHGARILPVDSEHSAIWQCLSGEGRGVSRLILTASGGPFLNYSPARLKGVSLSQALRHPSWQMGAKVTIDSATLMNKGLEVIEAHWLFGIPLENIQVLVHPQSIVHSMVEFVDGSVKAQLSYPDMRLPIQYALFYPERVSNPELPRLDWNNIKRLDFEPPDIDRFPCLRLAIEAGERGGTCPAVLCAADEAAVGLFVEEKIGFVDIARLVEHVLDQHQVIAHPGIEEIMAADDWARELVFKMVNGDS